MSRFLYLFYLLTILGIFANSSNANTEFTFAQSKYTSTYMILSLLKTQIVKSKFCILHRVWEHGARTSSLRCE